MRISLNNLWLTNDGVVDLRTWTDAHDVRLNGTQLVQDAQFLRAVSAQPIARGHLVHTLRFTVTQQHATVAAAAQFVLTAFSTQPNSGPAVLVCGAYGETPVTCSFAAVLESFEAQFHGTRTDLTYTLRGGIITVQAGAITASLDGGDFTLNLAGALDGGNLADALLPTTLNLDGGLFLTS